MAFRYLCTVTFATLGLVLACGGGPGSVSNMSRSDEAPTSDDPAPKSAEKPPAPSDQAPRNSDPPPYGSQPVGGGSGAPPSSSPQGRCEQLCEKFGGDEACPGSNAANQAVRALCKEGCDTIADVTCGSVYAAALDCLIALPALCTAEGPSESARASCDSAFAAAGNCGDDGTQ